MRTGKDPHDDAGRIGPRFSRPRPCVLAGLVSAATSAGVTLAYHLTRPAPLRFATLNVAQLFSERQEELMKLAAQGAGEAGAAEGGRSRANLRATARSRGARAAQGVPVRRARARRRRGGSELPDYTDAVRARLRAAMSATLERLIRTPALRAYGETLARHVGAYWVAYAVVLGAITVFNTHFTIGVNATPSLALHGLPHRQGRSGGATRRPGGVPLARRRPVPRRGRLHQDRAWPARGRSDPRGPGVLRERGRGRLGQALQRPRRAPLALGPTGVIPEGHYYVSGTHPDSLDSRYALAGWIPRECAHRARLCGLLNRARRRVRVGTPCRRRR